MPPSNPKAIREYQGRLQDVKRTYTAAVLGEGPTQTELKRLSSVVAKAAQARTAAGLEVTDRWLTEQPEFRRLASAVSHGAVSRSKVAQELLPELMMTTRTAAAEFVDAYDLPTPGRHHAAVAGDVERAEGYLLRRRRGVELTLGSRTATQVAFEASRPVKALTVKTVTDLATGRLAAETQHTLTVMSTETANAARDVVATALGPEGLWWWVGSGDDRMCDYCRERDGKLFQVSVIFTEPHVRCRCISVPHRGGR